MSEQYFPKVNDTVSTPNGLGVVQGRMYEGGHLYIVVRHVIKEMKNISMHNTLTKLAAAGDPRYPTGLWKYDISEVSNV